MRFSETEEGKIAAAWARRTLKQYGVAEVSERESGWGDAEAVSFAKDAGASALFDGWRRVHVFARSDLTYVAQVSVRYVRLLWSQPGVNVDVLDANAQTLTAPPKQLPGDDR